MLYTHQCYILINAIILLIRSGSTTFDSRQLCSTLTKKWDLLLIQYGNVLYLYIYVVLLNL